MNAAAKSTRRRAPPARTTRHRDAGGTLIGIFIGLALGLALAAVVAWTLMGGKWPGAQGVKGEPAASRDARTPRSDADKPRFDFYKILPGSEEPKIPAGERKAQERPDRAVADKAATQPSPARLSEPAKPADGAEKTAAAEPSVTKSAKPGDRFWLQVGSFTQESEAENLKARLALDGWEARVQSGTLADKTVRYRVRLGPYDNPEELNRMKSALAKRGFEAAVMKY